MQVVNGRRVVYNSDEEYYLRQVSGSRPRDTKPVRKAPIAEALRFLMVGGSLDHTTPPVTRADPGFGPGVRFLDVGCRDGWSLTCLQKGLYRGWTHAICAKRFPDVSGMELCRETVQYAQSRGRIVTRADVRKQRIADNAFDIVFTRHCLEHLDEPQKGLANIAAMLKPGGVLLAIVPKEDTPIDVQRSIHSYQFCADDDLANMVRAAGLDVFCHFRRDGHSYYLRSRWYKLKARLRHAEPELWVLARKPVG
jgi:SAM-dependent methyltransferase